MRKYKERSIRCHKKERLKGGGDGDKGGIRMEI